MILARIDGHAVTSIGHPSLKGRTIVLCTPIDETGASEGSPFAAIDTLGAGMHSRVFITTDGSWTQDTVHDNHSPIRNQVMGLVD
ncbi:MAG: ethanolamine utilization protein EutN [Opitutales bacterium]|jgi:ethanolamine utilization protein EutN|nr:ethanolamine utilization protein EutN [Opitutales bacterium]MDP4643221.1 ethanolamine utilization protein EutN [Opitutales bacterium]MDP4778264.1 ethanolamine utilization protein EutN [Opitutales bacterium]MDP4880178.1 ethanolamine utilization protein EutN [Opitutales bacterium]MDP4882501.1 ethanolamine utilization protein EutN [Opitutales bacterium]